MAKLRVNGPDGGLHVLSYENILTIALVNIRYLYTIQ